MNKGSEDKFKKKSLKRFVLSFKYCFEGMRYAFYHEQNIFVMLIAGIIALVLGILLKVSYMESLVLVSLIGVTLAFEMINTAVEACVNLVTHEIREDARHAKDCASAAVGILSVFDLIVGIMIFVPKIVDLF